MPKTLAKQHVPGSVLYNAATTLAFPPVALALSQANTAIQTSVVVPLNFKVYRVTVLLTGTVASTASINIVNGTGAEGAVGTADNSELVGYPPTLAQAGAVVFAADAAVTMAANAVTTLAPSVPDVIYGAGSQLTLRTVTSGTSTGTIAVQLTGAYVDIQPQKPINAALNVATDL